MKIFIISALLILSLTELAIGKEGYDCSFEGWSVVDGKSKTHIPSFKKVGTLFIDDKIIGDGSGKTQGLHLKGEGFVAHAMALRLPDVKNGKWEDLQLEIYKDAKEIYPRSLSHADLSSKKAVVTLLTKEKSLALTCYKN